MVSLTISAEVDREDFEQWFEWCCVCRSIMACLAGPEKDLEHIEAKVETEPHILSDDGLRVVMEAYKVLGDNG